MKIVVRRHAAEYQVFRSIAIAQAARAAAGENSEVFLESLDHFRDLLALTPSIRWKNPHHPYEVAARESKDPDGSSRRGGKLYDEVIDVDSDGPLETQWLNSGLPWWQYTTARAKGQTAFGAKLAIADFPTIETIDDLSMTDFGASDYILLAPLSPIANARQINVNKLEAYAKARFPSSAVFWIRQSGSDVIFFGDGRSAIHYVTYTFLAAILAGARAVFAVNGLVSALAQSNYKGIPLVRRYCHIRGTYGNAAKDISLKMASGLETSLDRAGSENRCGVITTDPGTLEIKEIAPLPAH